MRNYIERCPMCKGEGHLGKIASSHLKNDTAKLLLKNGYTKEQIHKVLGYTHFYSVKNLEIK